MLELKAKLEITVFFPKNIKPNGAAASEVSARRVLNILKLKEMVSFLKMDY